MSSWFMDRRQEFIAAQLKQFGQVRRGDLIRQFDISMPQASADIARFLESNPPRVTYDVSAKAYVLNDEAGAAITSTAMVALLDDPKIAGAVNEQGGGRHS